MLDEVEEEVADEQGWTASQATALQRAWLQINPTAPNFWQLVSKQVEGAAGVDTLFCCTGLLECTGYIPVSVTWMGERQLMHHRSPVLEVHIA